MPFSLKRVMAKHKGRLVEQWVFDAHTPLLSSATVSDIDGDGNPEVIFGTKDGTLYCLDHHAKQRWVYEPENKASTGADEYFMDQERMHAISSSPTVADITKDGKQEILFGAEDGTLHVVDHKGKLIWKQNIGGAIKASPKVVDLNNDGMPEILVTSSGRKMVVFTAKGKTLISFKVESTISSTPGVYRSPDGGPSIIIFGLDDGTVHAVDAQEKPLWTFKANDKVTAEPVFLKGAQPLVLIGSWDGTLYALNLNGELVWKFSTGGAIHNKAAIADLNKDGKEEVIFGSCDNNIYALTNTGEKLWSYETDFWVLPSPVVVDIDNDGQLEVVAGSLDNNVYVLEGEGSYELEYMPGLSGIINQAGHYADVLSQEPGERQGKRIWRYKTQGMIVGCTLLQEAKHTQLVVNVKSGFVDTLAHQS